MPAIPFNATLAFTSSVGNVTATVTGLEVETPVAQIVDMTGLSDPTGSTVQVPTGEIRGGSISVDFLYETGGADPQSLVGSYGSLTFSSTAYTVTRQVVLENANVSARTGELVSGRLQFRMTDYYG